MLRDRQRERERSNILVLLGLFLLHLLLLRIQRLEWSYQQLCFERDRERGNGKAMWETIRCGREKERYHEPRFVNDFDGCIQ